MSSTRGYRDTGVCQGNDRIDRVIDRRKRANGGRDGFGNSEQAERDFRRDAERSFRTDKQPREVVAGCGFSAAGSGLHDRAVCKHHFEVEDEFAHRSVPHRIGSRCPGRGHSPEAGVGTRIHGKEQPRVAEMLVQGAAGHARLYRAV